MYIQNFDYRQTLKIKIMKNKSVLFIIVLAAIVLASCVSVRKTVSTGGIGSILVEPLKVNQYDILKEVEGYGTATQFLIFGAFSKFGTEKGVVGKAIAKATYDAISKVEGADMIIAPKYEIESVNYLLFQKATVKVKAKALEIKSTK